MESGQTSVGDVPALSAVGSFRVSSQRSNCLAQLKLILIKKIEGVAMMAIPSPTPASRRHLLAQNTKGMVIMATPCAN
jgi:hypothetical protein